MAAVVAKRQKSDDPPYDGGEDDGGDDDGDDEDNGEDDEEEPSLPAPSDADTPGTDLSKVPDFRPTLTPTVIPTLPSPNANPNPNKEITELPEPRQSQEEATAKVFEVMKARGATQTAVCIRLSLSPVYFSMWLRHKDIPKSTSALYTVHIALILALTLALALALTLSRRLPHAIASNAPTSPTRWTGCAPT